MYELSGTCSQDFTNIKIFMKLELPSKGYQWKNTIFVSSL